MKKKFIKKFIKNRKKTMLKNSTTLPWFKNEIKILKIEQKNQWWSSSSKWIVDWLIGWLIGWLVGLVGWLVGLVGWLVGWFGWLVGWAKLSVTIEEHHKETIWSEQLEKVVFVRNTPRSFLLPPPPPSHVRV